MDSFDWNAYLVRLYLVMGRPMDGFAILRDGLVRGELGALAIVKVALSVRVNRRTRRSLDVVAAEARARGAHDEWYRRLAIQVYGLYRQLTVLALPHTGSSQQLLPAGKIPSSFCVLVRSPGDSASF